MLSVGDLAPDFTLASDSGLSFSLQNLRGSKVVLYFYPKDDTPGRTQEACDYRDNMARLTSIGVRILGVSRDSSASHQKFREKYNIPFPLLSDVDGSAALAYGAYGEKKMMGRTTPGIIRSTFIIDEEGRIAALWSPVRVRGHVDQVLAALGTDETI